MSASAPSANLTWQLLLCALLVALLVLVPVVNAQLGGACGVTEAGEREVLTNTLEALEPDGAPAGTLELASSVDLCDVGRLRDELVDLGVDNFVNTLFGSAWEDMISEGCCT